MGLLVAVASLVGLLLLLLGGLALLSPGRPRPLLDSSGRRVAGSLVEKLRVPINGVDQGMFVAAKDPTRPVLLFVHGGPGMPEYVISREYPIVLEDLFTVCWCEQRGAALSNVPGIPAGTLNMEQLVSDAIEVTRHLRARFGQDRIYLLGHSWGSVVAIQAAARAPECYRAYIGMGQSVAQLESEKQAYRYMLERYRAARDRRMVRALEKIPLTDLDAVPPAYRAIRDQAMHRLGIGTTHAMRSVVTGIFLPVMTSPEYTLGEKIALWRGKWSNHSTALWNDLMTFDLATKVPTLTIPAYFLHGAHDYTCSYSLARDYVARLAAPSKGFYTFPESAHSPLFEEPERARRILRDDVLAGAHRLADSQ